MKYNVTGFNNFCRVFQLPANYPRGYCFAGGISTTFLMVDWFNPVSDLPNPKGHDVDIDSDELQMKLSEWLKQKKYVISGATYLVICDFGLAFTFTK